MRLVILAALQTGWTAFAPAQAATPAAAAVSLAPGEVLLELEETGTTLSAADVVRVVIPVAVARLDAAAARKEAAAQAERIAAALRLGGVAPADIQVEEGTVGLGFVGNESLAASAEALAAQPVATPKTASYTVDVRLRDPAAFERLRLAAEKAGASTVPRPSLALADERPARQAARADAVRQARADAESYARTLGLRVGRTVRVSEKSSASEIGGMSSRVIMRMVGGAPPVPAGKVETTVVVDFDFALLPAS